MLEKPNSRFKSTTISSFLLRKRSFHRFASTKIPTLSAISDRHKKQATHPTQSSQDESSTDTNSEDDTTAIDTAVAGSVQVSSTSRKVSQKARENETSVLVGIAEVIESPLSQMKQLLEAKQQAEEANKRSG